QGGRSPVEPARWAASARSGGLASSIRGWCRTANHDRARVDESALQAGGQRAAGVDGREDADDVATLDNERTAVLVFGQSSADVRPGLIPAQTAGGLRPRLIHEGLLGIDVFQRLYELQIAVGNDPPDVAAL